MPPVISDALVLRTYKLGETSKVVVLLTRERGKLRAVAKGARGPRSRYQSALEPLSEVRASLHGRQGAELYRLGQCEFGKGRFKPSEDALEREILIALAGLAAEARYTGAYEMDAANQDLRYVRRLVLERKSERAASRYEERLLSKVEAMLADTAAYAAHKSHHGAPPPA